MTTADDILLRARKVLPASWFPDDSPVLDGVLMGFATVGAFLQGFIDYVKAQTRVGTASDGFLDIIAYDFFGLTVRRAAGESDDSFRRRIIMEVLRERQTKRGIGKALQDLTGSPATITEMFDPRDTGGYDCGTLAYGAAGAWGTLTPRQFFAAVPEPIGAGIPDASGYDEGHGAYGQPVLQYGSSSQIKGHVTDGDILEKIETTRAAGVTAWVEIGG